jgi:hypothetical protein
MLCMLQGGPPPAWLLQLWALLQALQPDLASGPAWDPLSGWALLPCTSGEVARIAHRHAIITPPVLLGSPAINAESAAAGDGVDSGRGSSEAPRSTVEASPGSPAAAAGSGPQGAAGGVNGALAGSPSFEEPWGQLAAVLAKMGCFVLDAR